MLLRLLLELSLMLLRLLLELSLMLLRLLLELSLMLLELSFQIAPVIFSKAEQKLKMRDPSTGRRARGNRGRCGWCGYDSMRLWLLFLLSGLVLRRVCQRALALLWRLSHSLTRVLGNGVCRGAWRYAPGRCGRNLGLGGLQRRIGLSLPLSSEGGPFGHCV